MYQLLKDFIKLFANAVMIICLMMASFLLFVNLYHYKEINYVYEADLNSHVGYSAYKKKLSDVSTRINAVNLNKVSASRKSAASSIKGVVTTCLDSLKNSDFNKLNESHSISSKDIYKINADLYNDINNKCLFYLGYNTNQILGTVNMQNSFSDTRKYVDNQRELITTSTNYLKDRLLSNSVYHYTTDITRNSVFNEVSGNLSLLVNNYTMIIDTVDEFVDWYTNQFGGAR